MATFTWNCYYGASPAWTDMSTNTLNFCGSPTDITTPITVGSWPSGMHLGTGDGSGDVCATNHVPYIKYVTNTQFDNGGGTETISTTNLAQTECQLQILFTDATAVTISNARFYLFDGTTTTAEAVGIEAYAIERVTGMSAWTQINDDSASIGGDNDSEHLDLADQGSATDHTYYIVLTARPETVGGKTQFDMGIALTYS